MKTLILTGHSPEYDALGALTIPNHRRYASLHGYDLHCCYNARGNRQADVWDKARWRTFLALLPHYDIVMTIGADALFMRMDTTLEYIFPEHYDQQIAYEKIGGCRLNNDVMLWRNTQTTVDLVNWILTDYEKHMEKSLFGYQQGLSDLQENQSHMVDKMNFVPGRLMNACPQTGHPTTWEEGDFIVHFMAALYADKITLARTWLEKVYDPFPADRLPDEVAGSVADGTRRTDDVDWPYPTA